VTEIDAQSYRRLQVMTSEVLLFLFQMIMDEIRGRTPQSGCEMKRTLLRTRKYIPREA
jgi:hypothetical protein